MTISHRKFILSQHRCLRGATNSHISFLVISCRCFRSSVITSWTVSNIVADKALLILIGVTRCGSTLLFFVWINLVWYSFYTAWVTRQWLPFVICECLCSICSHLVYLLTNFIKIITTAWNSLLSLILWIVDQQLVIIHISDLQFRWHAYRTASITILRRLFARNWWWQSATNTILLCFLIYLNLLIKIKLSKSLTVWNSLFAKLILILVLVIINDRTTKHF